MSHPFEYIASDYEFQHGAPTQVGKGGFGIVFEALQRSSFAPVAIKRVSLCPTLPHCLDRIVPATFDQQRVKQAAREILNQKVCEGFPYVAQLLDWYRSQDGFDVYLVLERWPGNLFGYLCKPSDFHFRGRILSIVQTPRVIMCQLLIALDFLHSRNIFHRDLSIGNVLVDASSGQVCIADFGTSKVVTEDNSDTADSTGYGTLHYRAPEVLCHCSANPQLRWTADIWSLGCIFMELLTGAPFVQAKDEPSQLACWLRVFNQSDPTDLRNLMKEHQCSQRFADFFASTACRIGLQAYSNLPTLADRLDGLTRRLSSVVVQAAGEEVEALRAETEATIRVATELIPAMLVLDPANRLPASALLLKGRFAEDPLCKVLLEEYQQLKARRSQQIQAQPQTLNQMSAVPDPIDPAVLAAFMQWDPISRILLRPRTADAEVPILQNEW